MCAPPGEDRVKHTMCAPPGEDRVKHTTCAPPGEDRVKHTTCTPPGEDSQTHNVHATWWAQCQKKQLAASALGCKYMTTGLTCASELLQNNEI